MELSDQPKAKGHISDILYHFPAVAARLGNTPTDESALCDLAVWLGHWQKRTANNRRKAPRFTLLGQLQEQRAKAPDTGKFLKACLRLHEALTPRLAAEQTAKKLLGPFFSAEKWQAVREAVEWWAGWLKEQGYSPVRQYLDSLKSIPVFQNVHHQWDLDARVCDDSISHELAPLQREFKHAYRELPAAQQQILLHELRILADFDTGKIKRHQEDYEQSRYSLDFLVSDIRPLWFPAWDGLQTVFNQVSPMFWTWLRACIAIRRGEARTLLVALGESITNIVPVATPAPEAAGAAKFGLRQVALMYVYEGKVIPKAADEIARQYGHKSGAKLYQHYLTVSQRAGRIGEDVVGQKLAPMIKDIAAVIGQLTSKSRPQAESELQTLEARK